MEKLKSTSEFDAEEYLQLNLKLSYMVEDFAELMQKINSSEPVVKD